MKREKKQESLYRVNATTGNTIIEISLEDYGEFFHEWDNTAGGSSRGSNVPILRSNTIIRSKFSRYGGVSP